MPLTKKVMVLFDPRRYQKVEEEAKRRHSSVGALIREAVDKKILEQAEVAEDVRLDAARRIISGKEEIPEWQEIERLIARGHVDE